jgi:hypothetical protein
MSVSLAYIFAAHEHNLQLAVIAAFSCILLGAFSVWIVDRARSHLEKLPIVIKKAKSADKEVIGFLSHTSSLWFFEGNRRLIWGLGSWRA